MASTSRLGRPPLADARHRQLAAALRARMRSGEWPPGSTLPAWRRLAGEYAVSVRVVQLAMEALKRDGLVAGTARRRLVARDWNSPGTALDRQLLVLLTSNPKLLLRGALYRELLTGILSGAGELGVPLQIAYDDRLSKGVPEELLDGPLLGVVLVGKVGAAALRGYERLALPVVLADHPGQRWKLHAAGVDNEAATEEMVERLAALGHRRVAFLRRMSIHRVHQVEPDAAARQAALEKSFSRRKLPKPGVYSIFPNDGSGAPGFVKLLQAKPAYTVVIAGDGGMARLLVEAARRAGRSIPRDLSLLAFGGAEPTASFSGVCFDFQDVGRRAVLLVREPHTAPRHERMAGVWVDAGSLAPPP